MTKEYDEIRNLEYLPKYNFYYRLGILSIFVCNACKAQSNGEEKFCRNCGQTVFKKFRTVSICNYCEILLDERFCSICGHKANSPKLTSSVKF